MTSSLFALVWRVQRCVWHRSRLHWWWSHNGPPRCWYADSLRYPCLWINSKEQSLLLYSLQLKHHRSEEVLVLFVRVAFQRHLHLANWSYAHGHFSNGDFTHASTRKQRALQCPSSSSTLLTGHFVKPRYCVVGHMAFSFGFCPLTDRYICLCLGRKTSLL